MGANAKTSDSSIDIRLYGMKSLNAQATEEAIVN
jgi:hypothetical protein